LNVYKNGKDPRSFAPSYESCHLCLIFVVFARCHTGHMYIIMIWRLLCFLPQYHKYVLWFLVIMLDDASSRGPHFWKIISKHSCAHLYLFIYMKNNCMQNFRPCWQLLNPPPHAWNFKTYFIFFKFTISLFFIVQRALKSWIIANLQEIVMRKAVCLQFEGKTLKIKPQKGDFGEKWQFWQILSMLRWV
jgi:hypothetical protein